MTPGSEWRLLRLSLLALMLSTLIYVTIPDYPWGTPFWKVACWDANGWLHECFYIVVGFLVMIDLTYWWQRRVTTTTTTRRVRRRKAS